MSILHGEPEVLHAVVFVDPQPSDLTGSVGGPLEGVPAEPPPEPPVAVAPAPPALPPDGVPPAGVPLFPPVVVAPPAPPVGLATPPAAVAPVAPVDVPPLIVAGEPPVAVADPPVPPDGVTGLGVDLEVDVSSPHPALSTALIAEPNNIKTTLRTVSRITAAPRFELCR
jgi:hypothetical protein